MLLVPKQVEAEALDWFFDAFAKEEAKNNPVPEPERFHLRRDVDFFEDFRDWLWTASPEMQWDWTYLVYIQFYLGLITAGEIKRLMLFVPPRHGKTEMTTVRYPVYRLNRDPMFRVIVGSYNSLSATRFSRKALRIAKGRVNLSRDRRATNEWETPEGGAYLAAGVGGGVTGAGANLLLVDDPIKSREEAKSAAFRERVYDWWTNDMSTRLEPGGAAVIINTRWHEQDLSGQILDSEDGVNWCVISLPALAEENDPLFREVGEALCRERYDEADLLARQIELGNNFYALYQQRPQAPQGEFYETDKIRVIDNDPPGKRAYCRYWDKAGTEGGGKLTAGILMSVGLDGTICVHDRVAGQWSALNREERIFKAAERDKNLYGRVRVGVEMEPGSGGKESAENTARNLHGFNVWLDRPTGDKETRAEPFAAQVAAGNVSLVKGSWNRDYLANLASFPNGKFKDDSDASAGAYNWLAAQLAQFRRKQIAVPQGITGKNTWSM